MGLVNELQESAERDDVLTVLRKANRVSAKLNVSGISEWLKHEQDGYPGGDSVPSYRKLSVVFCYNTNGYIPAGYGYIRKGVIPFYGPISGLTFPLVDSIGTVVSLLISIDKGKELYFPVPDNMASDLRNMLRSDNPDVLQQLTFHAKLNNSQIRDIPEQVKNKVLDWACVLESAGVTGEGHTFSPQEKQNAQTVVFNISNSTIEQLNSSGPNIKRQRSGE